MARLSDEEKAVLKRLQEKADAPDEPAATRHINATIDFGDEKQIQRAIDHGFLTAKEAKELKEGDDDDKKKGTSTPRRRGSYFKDGDDE